MFYKEDILKTFNFILDKNSKIKLYFQLYQQICDQILSGEIPLGTKLPSVRALSTQLGTSKNTVIKALEALQKDGFLISKNKSGYYTTIPEEKKVTSNIVEEEISETKNDKISKQKNSIITVDDILQKASTLSAVPEEENIPYDKNLFVKLNDKISIEKENIPEATYLSAEEKFSKEFSDLPPVSELLPAEENEIIFFPENSSPLEKNEDEKENSIKKKILKTYLSVLNSDGFSELNKSEINFDFEYSIKNSFLYKNLSPENLNFVYETNIFNLLKNISSLTFFKNQNIKTAEEKPQIHGLLHKANVVNFINKNPSLALTFNFSPSLKQDEKIFSALKQNNFSIENLDCNCLDEDFIFSKNASFLIFKNQDFLTEDFLEKLFKNDSAKNKNTYIFCLTKDEIKFYSPKIIYLSSLAPFTNSKINSSWALLSKEIYVEYRNKFLQDDSGLSLIDKSFCAKFISSLNEQV